MKLFLQRHCHSVEGERMDSTLPLTSKGIAEAKYMRQFRKDLGIKFDVAFVSDFTRTQQTADIVVNKKAARFDMKELRPNGTAEDAFAAMYRSFDIQDDTLVYVCTHNPLIQQMAAAGWLGFNADANQFAHGSMLRIDTHTLPPEKHPLHWLIRPGLIEHMYESDLVESATQFVEHLGRASKARIVDPLIEAASRSLSSRFTKQGRKYLRTKTITLQQTTGFRRRFERLIQTAYEGGVEHVAGVLAVLREAKVNLATKKQPPGYDRTATDIEDQIDATSRDRIASIESDGLAKGLTAAAIATAIRQQFRDWAGDRAQTIATQEVSRAFHQGGTDVARIVNEENGGRYVEKHWDTQDNPCELCIENEDAGWIGVDEDYPNFGARPPGHPNCQCSESFRTVGQSEEAHR